MNKKILFIGVAVVLLLLLTKRNTNKVSKGVMKDVFRVLFKNGLIKESTLNNDAAIAKASEVLTRQDILDFGVIIEKANSRQQLTESELNHVRNVYRVIEPETNPFQAS